MVGVARRVRSALYSAAANVCSSPIPPYSALSPAIRRSNIVVVLSLLFAFAAGFTIRGWLTGRQQTAGPLPRIPADGWPELDSARAVALAKAAYFSEFHGWEQLRVDSVRRGPRMSWYVGLSPDPISLGGGSEVRVSDAGGACVMSFTQ